MTCRAESRRIGPMRSRRERTDSGDLLLRHKTSWRELYDSEVKRLGTDEVIFCNQRGELTEGARSNIFIRRDGMLLTPPLDAGVLHGRLARRTDRARQGARSRADAGRSDRRGLVRQFAARPDPAAIRP